MALINCPECKREISDFAKACPHCGCPLHIEVEQDNERMTSKEERQKVRLGKRIMIGLLLLVILGSGIAYIIIGRIDKARLETAENAVVKIVCFDYEGDEVSSGSGFFYKNDKNIVTNYHVIENAYTAKIITNDDVSFEVAEVVYASKEMDLAVVGLKNSSGYPYLKSGKMSYIEKGNDVYAIGSPLGIKNTLSKGIISGRNMEQGVEVIQFTAPISSGSSGGALLDKHGRVLGVTYASYEGGQNLNLAIPIDLVEKLYETNRLFVSLSEFNRERYQYAWELEKLKVIGGEIQVMSFDEYRKNYSRYLGEMVMFEAYISSKDRTEDSLGTYKYFISTYDNVSGSLGNDIISWGRDANSPYLMLTCYHEMANKFSEYDVGERVWVVTAVAEETENMFFPGYLVYNDEKCFSIVNFSLESVLDKDTYERIIKHD